MSDAANMNALKNELSRLANALAADGKFFGYEETLQEVIEKLTELEQELDYFLSRVSIEEDGLAYLNAWYAEDQRKERSKRNIRAAIERREKAGNE